MSHYNEHGGDNISLSVTTPNALDASGQDVTLHLNSSPKDTRTARLNSSINPRSSTSSVHESYPNSQDIAIMSSGVMLTPDRLAATQPIVRAPPPVGFQESESISTRPEGEVSLEATKMKGASRERKDSNSIPSEIGPDTSTSLGRNSTSSIVLVEPAEPITEVQPVVETVKKTSPKLTAVEAPVTLDTKETGSVHDQRPSPGMIKTPVAETRNRDAQNSEERSQGRFQGAPREMEQINVPNSTANMRPKSPSVELNYRDTVRHRLNPSSWICWLRNRQRHELEELHGPRKRDCVRSKLLSDKVLKIMVGRRPTTVVKPIVDEAAMGPRNIFEDVEIKLKNRPRPFFKLRHERKQKYHTARAEWHLEFERRAEQHGFPEAQRSHAEKALHHSKRALRYTSKIGRAIERHTKEKSLAAESPYNAKSAIPSPSPRQEKSNMQAEYHLREARKHLEHKLDSGWRHLETEQDRLSNGLQNGVRELEDKLGDKFGSSKHLGHRVLGERGKPFGKSFGHTNAQGESRIRRETARHWKHHSGDRNHSNRILEYENGQRRPRSSSLREPRFRKPANSTAQDYVDMETAIHSHL